MKSLKPHEKSPMFRKSEFLNVICMDVNKNVIIIHSTTFNLSYNDME